MLAENNLYEIDRMRVWTDGQAKPLPEPYRDLPGPAADIRATDAFIQVFYRKRGSLPFMPPLDHLEGDADGTTFRGMLRRALAPYYSPVEMANNAALFERVIEMVMQNRKGTLEDYARTITGRAPVSPVGQTDGQISPP